MGISPTMKYRSKPWTKKVIDNNSQSLTIKMTFNLNDTIRDVQIDYSWDLEKGIESKFSRIELHRNDFRRLKNAINSINID